MKIISVEMDAFLLNASGSQILAKKMENHFALLSDMTNSDFSGHGNVKLQTERDFLQGLVDLMQKLRRARTHTESSTMHTARRRIWALWNSRGSKNTTVADDLLSIAHTLTKFIEADRIVDEVSLLVTRSTLLLDSIEQRQPPPPTQADALASQSSRSIRHGRVLTRSSSNTHEWTPSVSYDLFTAPDQASVWGDKSMRIVREFTRSIHDLANDTIRDGSYDTYILSIEEKQTELKDNIKEYDRDEDVPLTGVNEEQTHNDFTDGARHIASARLKLNYPPLRQYFMHEKDLADLKAQTIVQLNLVKDHFGWNQFTDNGNVDELLALLAKPDLLQPCASDHLNLVISFTEGTGSVITVAGQFTEYPAQ